MATKGRAIDGKRVAARRIKLGMGQPDLAKKAGMKQQGIDSIEKGKSRRPRKLRELAKALLTTEAYLLRETNDPELAHGDRPASISSVGGARGIPDQTIAEIDVTAGLGGGGVTIITDRAHEGAVYSAEHVRDYWRLPEWLLRSLSASAQNVVCFPAQGDSMAPTVQNGDVVFADLRHRVPSPPGIYVLADAFGGVVVKRLEVVSRPGEDPVQVKVGSDNPKHETAVWTLDEINIIGRYLGRFTVL